MAKNKYTSRTVLVEISDDGTSYTPVGCARDITPPPESLVNVESDCLDTGKVESAPGLEEVSEFTFIEAWDPAVTVLDAAKGLSKYWRLRYNNGVANQEWEEKFQGYVRQLIPQTLARNSDLARQITVVRTTDITRAAYTPPGP